MVDLISFQLKKSLFSFECPLNINGIIKQIMTGPSGNRQSICPLRFRIASPKNSIDLSCASVNRNSAQAILNLLGQIDLPITLETSQYLFIVFVVYNRPTLS